MTVTEVRKQSLRLRTWPRRLVEGGHQLETCPSWCTDHHRGDAFSYREDLAHGAYFDGADVAVFNREEPGTVAMPVFAGRVSVEPYSPDPARRVPHVNLEPWADEVMECLGPAELAATAALLRRQADRIDRIHDELIAARATA